MPRRRVVRKKRGPILRKMPPNNLPPRQDTPEAIKNLLEPILTIDIEDPSSPESDIPDVFEEVHKNHVLTLKNGQKPLTKYEADVLTMDRFTDLHKTIIQNLREELNIGDNLFYETYDDITKTFEEFNEPKPLLPSTTESIREKLNDPGIVTFDQNVQAESNEINCDYMTGIWKMIEEHCKGKELVITQPNYDAFNQLEPHWLNRPSVPQEVLDESKNKCYKWLSEQHEL